MVVSFQKKKQLSDYYTIVLVSFPLGEYVDEIDDSEARYEGYRYDVHFLGIVGKGGHTSLSPPFLDQSLPFSEIHPFLEIQDIPHLSRAYQEIKSAK